MSDDELVPMSLFELAGGAVGERFDYEFQKVIENALDPNRDAEAKRSINLKLSIKPNEKRNGATMSFEVVPKLAPLSKISEPIHFGRHSETGEAVAVRSDPNQLGIFRSNDDTKVVPINSKEGTSE